MLQALFQLSVPGAPARFGDDDGGRVFDPGRNRAAHLLDPLATGAILFNRGDFKHVAGGLREETIWLMGRKGVEVWDQLETPRTPATSSAFACAGTYVLAAGGSQVVLNGAPSVPQSYGHAHADALSVCLQSDGVQLLIDSGTREYVGPGSLRDLFRSTAMHNTLRVNGKDQAEPAGPFSWKRPVRARTEQWIVGECFSLFVGSHDGYQRLPSPVEHQRWVLALEPGIFLVRDLAQGQGEHHLDISWHLAPELEPQQAHLFRTRLFRTKNRAKGLAILPAEEHGWAEEIRTTPWSPVYGQQQETTVLNFGANVSLPAEFVTLLVPVLDADCAPGTFTRFAPPEATALVRAYRYEAHGVDYHFFFGRKGQSWKCGEVISDAEFLCLTVPAGRRDPDVILCNGSYAEVGGTRILSMKGVVAWCELIQGATRQVFCSNAEAIVPPLASAL
jgi:hypothetical protein